MKKILQFTFLLLVKISFGQGTLLYHFPFNNSLSAVGNSVSFTCGNPVYTSDDVNLTGALLVDYSTLSTPLANHITGNFPNLPILNAARSVAFRVKFTTLNISAEHFVFQYGESIATGAFGFNPKTTGGTLSTWGATNETSITNSPLEAGVWYNIALTYSAGVTNFYINGTLTFTTTFFTTSNLQTGATQIALGRSIASNYGFGSFALDHLRFYSGAINQAQINTLVLDQPVQELAYHFPFNGNLRTSAFSQGVSLNRVAASDAVQYADSNTSLLIAGGSNSSELSVNLPLLPVGNAARTVHMRIKINAYPVAVGQENNSHRIFNYGSSVDNNAYGWSQNNQSTTNHFFWGSTDINIINTVTAGTWYSMTFVCDGTNVLMYKDGVLQLTTPRTLNTTGTNFYIGTVLGQSSQASSYLNATIDDLKIYTIALTQSQISSLITTGSHLSTNKFNTNNLKFNLYPNPANSILNIDLATEIKNVEIYSLQGQKVLSATEKQVNIAGLPSGMYIIRVQDVEGAIATQKLVKK